MSPSIETGDDTQLVEAFLERLASDVGMIVDREIKTDDVRVERLDARVAGEGCVHISFRLAFVTGERMRQGTVVVPLAEAVTLAAFLMMMPDEDVDATRELDELDRPMKEAMLELCNFIAGAIEAVVTDATLGFDSVRPAGCQGVRADVRPALEYEEGEELLVVRAQATIGSYDAFELILQLPV